MQRRNVTFKLDPNAAQRVRLEAWTRLHLSDTRQLKPSQQRSACWTIVPKTFAERVHVFLHCGHVQPRDRNSALGVLIDAHTPGAGVAARPKPLPPQQGTSRPLTRETPAITPCVERRERSSVRSSCEQALSRLNRVSRVKGFARPTPEHDGTTKVEPRSTVMTSAHTPSRPCTCTSPHSLGPARGGTCAPKERAALGL